jgi:hypothetical protein
MYPYLPPGLFHTLNMIPDLSLFVKSTRKIVGVWQYKYWKGPVFLLSISDSEDIWSFLAGI